jgi:hypothetical protein
LARWITAGRLSLDNSDEGHTKVGLAPESDFFWLSIPTEENKLLICFDKNT